MIERVAYEAIVATGLTCALCSAFAARGLVLGYFSVIELRSACPELLAVAGLIFFLGMILVVVTKRAMPSSGNEVLLASVVTCLVIGSRGWIHLQKLDALGRTPPAQAHSALGVVLTGVCALKEGVVIRGSMTAAVCAGAASVMVLRWARNARRQNAAPGSWRRGLVVAYLLSVALSVGWWWVFGNSLEVNVESMLIAPIRHGISVGMLLMLGAAVRSQGSCAWRSIDCGVYVLAAVDLSSGALSAVSATFPGGLRI